MKSLAKSKNAFDFKRTFVGYITNVRVSENIQNRIDRWPIYWKVFRRKARGLLGELFQHLLEETEENNNKNLYSGRDSNEVFPEYKTRAVLLHQSVQ
jgi:hypothetical protein